MACVMSLGACALNKAQIDYTASEGILWPGGDQPPRIAYLWSFKRVAGADDSELMTAISGGYQYDTEFSPIAEENETLVFPHGVFVDDNKMMYITDPGGKRVCVVDLDKMEEFNITEAGELHLQYPLDVVADAQGRIYVTDPDIKGLFVFDKKGNFLKLIDGPFERPTGLAMDARRGIFYVADTWGHSIYKYSTEGALIGTIGEQGDKPGALNYPTHIAVDRDGKLYVSDTLNFRVQVFGVSGEFLNSFGLQGDTYDTFDKIKGIAVDSKGHIYIADSAQGMVKIYDQRGRLLLFFGKPGSMYGEFEMPAGLYMDHTDRLFVVDSFNRRIQAFRFLGGE